MNFEIDKGVEVPNPGRGPNGVRYPWADMEPGDSFVLECSGENRCRVQNSVGSSGRNYMRLHRPDCIVVTRKVEGGLRVWLVE